MLGRLASVIVAVTLLANHGYSNCVHTCHVVSDSTCGERHIYVSGQPIVQNSHLYNYDTVHRIVPCEMTDCPLGDQCRNQQISAVYLPAEGRTSVVNSTRMATPNGWPEASRRTPTYVRLSIREKHSSRSMQKRQSPIYQQICCWLI